MSAISNRVLNKVFGGGVEGWMASLGVSWLQKRMSESRQGEQIDMSSLVPGETYTVTVRPAPSRAERKLAKRYAKVSLALERASVESRSRKRVARKLAKVQRTVDRARPGSRKETRSDRRADALLARYDRKDKKRDMRDRLSAAVDVVGAQLADVQRQALEAERAKLAKKKTTVRRRRLGTPSAPDGE